MILPSVPAMAGFPTQVVTDTFSILRGSDLAYKERKMVKMEKVGGGKE